MYFAGPLRNWVQELNIARETDIICYRKYAGLYSDALKLFRVDGQWGN